MRIVYLASGAGSMYCGSCLQSNTLVAALRRAGEDALMVPVYTPVRTDEENVGIRRMAFGGLNVYLQQKSALFRHTPRFVDKLLDHPGLLCWLGGRSSSTRPESLGALTVSMLQGEEGRQQKELAKLVGWLKREVPPDMVHLSNVLLVGMARELHRQLDVPVVCTLSGEDIFLENLPQPHYSAARRLLRERSAELAALVAMNGYYADFMAEYLNVDREKIHVIPPGLNLDGHGTGPERAVPARDVVTIGYLARICPEKGLHLLAEAFELLSEDGDLPRMRLLTAGYLGKRDKPYLEEIQSRLTARRLADRFKYLGELDRAGKIAFLRSLDIMSVPTVYRESKGISVLEAWANGVPVVLPDHGAFPELVKDTGGGLLCRPNDAKSLADCLKQIILAEDQGRQHGRRGQAAVRDRYHADLMARRTVELYKAVLANR
jgi:glycosyltransferase involved in cell wall biosynthesis